MNRDNKTQNMKPASRVSRVLGVLEDAGLSDSERMWSAINALEARIDNLENSEQESAQKPG